MKKILKTVHAEIMHDSLISLTEYFKNLYPHKEVTIFFSKEKYHIMIDGKILETLSITSVKELHNQNDTKLL